jgi:general secretion pathway protein A
MYTHFFGLHENPFALPPDPGYLYLGRAHQEALAHLRYGIEQGGGFVQLTGEVGTGKTLLVRSTVERLPDNVDVALILYPILSVFEFVAAICDELRVSYPSGTTSLKDLIDALNAHLLESHATGRRTVLVIDEAQNLNREVLEQVRLLTNLETTKQKLLQIVLIGQPELDSLLAQRDLRQLAQRITARYRLTSLTRRETYDYILHRCRVAGAKTPLFSRAALRWAHTLSNGVPRLINVICDRALLGAYSGEQSVVDAAVVRRAAAELDLGTRARVPGWLPLATAAGLGALAIGALFWYGRLSPPSAPATTATAERRVPETALLAGSSVVTLATGERAAQGVAATPVALDVVLQQHATSTDTDSALKLLFARWKITQPGLSGANACARALQAGLRCTYRSGTWNNLRGFNRPAIVELIDGRGHSHHVLIVEIGAAGATIELAGQRHEIAFNEIDRLWFGEYMLLWPAQLLAQGVLRQGAQGPAVAALRAALSAYRGEPGAAATGAGFDEPLELRVKEFQRAHRLTPDGAVGELTALYLSSYERDASLPRLVNTGVRH